MVSREENLALASFAASGRRRQYLAAGGKSEGLERNLRASPRDRKRTDRSGPPRTIISISISIIMIVIIRSSAIS